MMEMDIPAAAIGYAIDYLRTTAVAILQIMAAGLIIFHLYRKDKKALAVKPDFKYVPFNFIKCIYCTEYRS